MISIVFYIIVYLVILKFALKSAFSIYDGGECLVGKVAIITGGNRGIGFEVSKCLASRGCKIIIGCRSKADNERKKLVELTHNENIIIKHLDLTSFESVRNFAKEINKTEDKIDILINNAGIGAASGVTVDGLNPVMQCNVFSPFLLTHLLADLLKRSNDGRIVFSSSIVAFYSNLTLDNLNPISTCSDNSLYNFFQIYGNTKLAELIISKNVSEKLKKYGIKSNAVHPGMINTDIWHGLELQSSPKIYDLIIKWVLYIIIFFYSRTPLEGAQGIVALAVSDKYKATTGQFYWGFGMANIYPDPRLLSDKSFCNEFWKKLEGFAKLTPGELLS